MGVSWGAMAGAFLAPFMYALYSKWVSTAACWTCFAFGSVLMTANMLIRPAFPAIIQSPINAGAVAMMAGLLIVPIVSALTPKPDQKLVDDAFTCYDEKITVPLSTSLNSEK